MNTNFRDGLEKKMKDKGLTDSSINLYIKNLQRLNDDKPLNNFNFLKNVDETLKKLNNYKETTKRAYLVSIVSALKTDDKNKTSQNLYKKYRELMENKNKELREEGSKNEKTETQEKNWMDQDEITNIYNELNNKVSKIKSNKKDITEREFNLLLNHLVLSLYQDIPPRRNDYLNMRLVGKEPNDESYNYLVLDDKPRFIYNVFKTAKKEGQVIQDVPENLLKKIKLYLKYRNDISKLNKNLNVPFLVHFNGDIIGKHKNDITRILNKIFHPKKISSSMLRHIYLSGKYGDTLNEMKNDSKLMSHSLGMQKDYVKLNDNEIEI